MNLDERSCDKDLSRINEYRQNPDIDLEICVVARRHGMTEADVRNELAERYPENWNDLRGENSAGFQDDEFLHAAEKRVRNRVDDMIVAFGVTDEDVAGIKETEHLYKQVFPRGHLIAIVGLPGSGKTTIMEYICSQLEGRILYINADISAVDIPEAQRRAKAGDYSLLCPDLKAGQSIEDVVRHLEVLACSGDSLTDTVFVIDTLKKINEVISKGQSAKTYKMLRSLTGRGATVICLGHCNKYPDKDGWPIYEGTSDLRSDFDELALLHANKGSYGQVTVSLYWDEQGLPWGKTRAILQAQSWIIDLENGRTVEEIDEWVDTVQESKDFRTRLQTGDVIREVYNLLLKHGEMTQGEILQRLEGIHGQHVIRRVLKQQEGKSWTISIGENNAHVHTAIPNADIPLPKTEQWGRH